MFLNIQSKQSEKAASIITELQNETKKMSTTETFRGNKFVTVFSIQFSKNMKNQNKTIEIELIMMIYIFFTIIENKIIS